MSQAGTEGKFIQNVRKPKELLLGTKKNFMVESKWSKIVLDSGFFGTNYT
ncbi:hypothetical protein J2TS6_38430 [Paenibacillus albilobatus]|uniref:Uncharacterized protein n=1 Tax=Paenibacillus albilobatus TaxID=2716884 RepID=A0A919XH27_9BACL|nr:hypothetical protein J2TS6_38430 [Paenibacillus albilobatus]